MNGWQQHRFLRHWRKKHIKNGHIVLLLVICVVLSVYFLRQNNLKMDQLRNEVIKADQSGVDVSGALVRLNHHVFNHMNTQIVRPVELVESYNRAAKVAIEEANKASGRDVYAEATAACERRGVPLVSIAQCAADYATINNPGVGSQKINLPNKNLFTHTFATPLWTPDAAGISLVVTVVVLTWITLRLLEYILVRLIVRHRLRNTF